jgi:hypothetical protein
MFGLKGETRCPEKGCIAMMMRPNSLNKSNGRSSEGPKEEDVPYIFLGSRE